MRAAGEPSPEVRGRRRREASCGLRGTWRGGGRFARGASVGRGDSPGSEGLSGVRESGARPGRGEG